MEPAISIHLKRSLDFEDFTMGKKDDGNKKFCF